MMSAIPPFPGRKAGRRRNSAPWPSRNAFDELAPEQRKIIFDPLPRVDGIDPAGDPLTDVRSEIYLLSGRRRRAAAAV